MSCTATTYRTIVLAVAPTAVATVDNSTGNQGRVTGVAAGVVEIHASLGALHGSAAITVTDDG